jgi:tetratricopeptide (TPR) repeat protein
VLRNFGAVFLCIFFAFPTAAQQAASETTLAAVRRSDAADRDAQGNLRKLTPTEHMRRAGIYLSVRAFAEARAHWQTLIDNYPQDPRVPEALLGIGRSYFLGKVYQDGYVVFNQLAQQYDGTKEGREALNFSAASLLRMGKFSEAAARYAEYVNRFPNGERIDTAHLNVIDTLREANRPAEALQWVTRTRQKFAGTAVETNAMFAALRLYIAEDQWNDAVNMADQLLQRSFPKAVLTSASEVAYLKAFSLEHAGRKQEAVTAYLAVPDSIESYYGWLATQRLDALAGPSRAEIVAKREERVNSAIDSVADSYPAPYRQAILSAAKSRKLDPRFYSRAHSTGECIQATREVACGCAWVVAVDDGCGGEVWTRCGAECVARKPALSTGDVDHAGRRVSRTAEQHVPEDVGASGRFVQRR